MGSVAENSVKLPVGLNNYSDSMIKRFRDNCFSTDKSIRVQIRCGTLFLANKVERLKYQ